MWHFFRYFQSIFLIFVSKTILSCWDQPTCLNTQRENLHTQVVDLCSVISLKVCRDTEAQFYIFVDILPFLIILGYKTNFKSQSFCAWHVQHHFKCHRQSIMFPIHFKTISSIYGKKEQISKCFSSSPAEKNGRYVCIGSHSLSNCGEQGPPH